MAGIGDVLEWKTVEGEPMSAGEVSLTPRSQALILRWPFGGFVWNRPVAVLVERAGRQERMRIVDATRIIQLGLLALVALSGMLSMWQRVRQRRVHHGRDV
jgi:hypothetical protein